MFIQRKGTQRLSQRDAKTLLCENLCALCVNIPTGRDSLQKVHISPRIAIGNHNCSHSSLIEIFRPRAAYDGIDIAKLTQAPQARNQQVRADAWSAFILGHTGWTKECSARAFVSGEANHSTRARGNHDRHRLIGKANRNLISPGNREVVFNELAHRSDFKRLGAANVDALVSQSIKRRQLQKIYQQVGHREVQFSGDVCAKREVKGTAQNSCNLITKLLKGIETF